LKKRTKKLLPVQVRGLAGVSDRCEGAGTKVFWFFFSKKNSFFLVRQSLRPRVGSVTIGEWAPVIATTFCMRIEVVGALTHG